jgi:putative N6-adenine-specific DNA methylase
MKEIFITCATSLEHLLFEELKQLGIPHLRKGYRGVFAPKKMEYIYKVNYCSRLATRVLWPLLQFPCPNRDALYSHAKKISWGQFLKLNQTFSIDANVSSHPNLKHSLFAALVVKDALCDVFREKCGERPNVDNKLPDVQFNLFIHKGIATISFDTSGDPLHKRGYKEGNTIAPLQESLAAAILLKAGYHKDEVLCDPFCGSGTFLIEAAMMATHTPAGFFRKKWGFFHLPDFSEEEWAAIKKEADLKKIPLEKGKIFGADKDGQSLNICAENLASTGFDEDIDLKKQDISLFQPKQTPTLLVTNPPYGKRLQSFVSTYQLLGDFLRKKQNAGIKSFILAPGKSSIQAIGLPTRSVLSLSNGGLDVDLYGIFSPSK